ncbi:hypothetical protein JL09_g7089, partial [Pichia kudriavzevii]
SGKPLLVTVLHMAL